MILAIGLWTFLRTLFIGSAAVALENLALRHQLLVLQRSVGRPRLARRDRVPLGLALSIGSGSSDLSLRGSTRWALPRPLLRTHLPLVRPVVVTPLAVVLVSSTRQRRRPACCPTGEALADPIPVPWHAEEPKASQADRPATPERVGHDDSHGSVESVCVPPTASLDDLIRPRQHCRWDGQAEGLRGLEVDNQLKLRGLLDRNVTRLGPPQDLVHEERRASPRGDGAWTIRHEAPTFDILPQPVH